MTRLRGPLGLRGRIVGAVLVTTSATLFVAAIALLGPLEHKLRDAELKTLQGEVTSATTSTFRILNLEQVLEYGIHGENNVIANHPGLAETGRKALQRLGRQESQLGQRIGASEVALLGLFDAHGRGGKVIVVYPTDSEIAESTAYNDAVTAARTRRPTYSLGTINGTEYARAAIPFATGANWSGPAAWVLTVRKPLDTVSATVAAVRKAFVDAALAGAALMLLLAIPLAGTLVRRLRLLRMTALRLADGDLSVDVPTDRSRDEVGDLARTFALMQERLQAQEEARRAFVATASHELRTPLTSLDGMLELIDDDLRSGTPDVQDARELLDRARVQSRRLGRLAADLLDLSRLDADVKLRSEPVELGELSRAVIAEFELGTYERGITTELDDSSGAVWALGDPGSVARILRILLDNAVRVSPDGSEIRITLSNGDYASLSVIDQGRGVPSDERELIFERFQRGREATAQAGFGLGLAIGRELAERMGGELLLDERDGSGATFTMRLPVAPARDPEIIAVV
jgi:signal transduction histidine kinase